MTTTTRSRILPVLGAGAVLLTMLSPRLVSMLPDGEPVTTPASSHVLSQAARVGPSISDETGLGATIPAIPASSMPPVDGRAEPGDRPGEKLSPPTGDDTGTAGPDPSFAGSEPPSPSPTGAPPGSQDGPPDTTSAPDGKKTTTTTVAPKTTTTGAPKPGAECGDVSVSVSGVYDVYTYWISQDCFSGSSLQAFSTQGTFGSVTAPSDDYCAAVADEAWCWLYTPSAWNGQPYWDAFNVWVVDKSGNQSAPIRIDLCVNC